MRFTRSLVGVKLQNVCMVRIGERVCTVYGWYRDVIKLHVILGPLRRRISMLTEILLVTLDWFDYVSILTSPGLVEFS